MFVEIRKAGEKSVKRYRIYFALVAFGILLNTAINHLDVIWVAINDIADIFAPVLIGAIIAFVLNAPIQWFANNFKKWKVSKNWPEKRIHIISLFLTLIALIAILTVVIVLIVPNMITSLTSAYNTVIDDMPQILAWLQENNINTQEIEAWLKNFDVTKMASVSGILSQTLGFASKVAGTIFQISISYILALYILLDKYNLKKWALKIAYAALPNKAPFIVSVYKKLERSYFDFFTGQIFEACVLGCLMFIAMTWAQIPYALLIAVLTSIFAFVPYIGAWFAGGVGAIFILFDDPRKALLSIVIYAIVQFIENQFIYPRVVGNKVGLSPLMTLGSVIVGGSLMGLFGMIFFIPLVTVIRDLAVDKINQLNEQNGYIAADEKIEEIESIDVPVVQSE